MRHITRLSSIALVLVMVLVGCSGDGGSSDGGSNEGGDDNASTESDDGSDAGDDSSNGGSADLGDLAIPAPPVGEAALTTDAEDTTIYTITFAGDDFEMVKDFYDDWTSSQSDQYQRTEAESGGVTWLATVDDRLHIIALSPPIEGDDRGFVTLTDGPAG